MAHCDRCPLREGGRRCFGEVQSTICALAETPAGARHVELRSAVAEGWAPPIPPHVEPAPAPPAYPSLRAQARGLAGALAAWARAGFPVAPAVERRRRRSICAGGLGRPACKHYDPGRRRCRKCGCFGDVKPWLATAACPVGKWGG